MSALISQWKSNELRDKLKAAKVHLDDADKAAKALLTQKVKFDHYSYYVR